MKEKIVGIVVLMLVATTVVSATNINVKEKIKPTSFSVDVPVWKKGDSWTYNEQNTQYRYFSNGTLWLTWIRNNTCTDTVTDDSGGNYTIKITSKDNVGKVIVGSYRLKITSLTKYTEDYTLRKTDLAVYHSLFVDKGLVIWSIGNIGFPFPAQYHYQDEVTEKTPDVFLPFPLIAGTQGNLPGYSYAFQEKMSLYWGLISLVNNPVKNYTQSALPYHCEMANITVPKGTYNAYNASVDVPNGMHGFYSVWRYYAPEVGNQAKVYIYFTNSAGKLLQKYNLELVSTTYTP